MSRVRKSSIILHGHQVESTALTWEGLILAAESELQRIGKRAEQLRHAIELFRARKKAGDPCIGSQDSGRATQN